MHIPETFNQANKTQPKQQEQAQQSMEPGISLSSSSSPVVASSAASSRVSVSSKVIIPPPSTVSERAESLSMLGLWFTSTVANSATKLLAGQMYGLPLQKAHYHTQLIGSTGLLQVQAIFANSSGEEIRCISSTSKKA